MRMFALGLIVMGVAAFGWIWRAVTREPRPDRVSEHWIRLNGYDKRGY